MDLSPISENIRKVLERREASIATVDTFAGEVFCICFALDDCCGELVSPTHAVIVTQVYDNINEAQINCLTLNDFVLFGFIIYIFYINYCNYSEVEWLNYSHAQLYLNILIVPCIKYT